MKNVLEIISKKIIIYEHLTFDLENHLKFE